MSPKVTELDKQIAVNIRALRNERKLTQPDVAGFLGISYQSYQKMERGVVSFRASTLLRLCALFDIRPDDIMLKNCTPFLGVNNMEQLSRVALVLERSDTETADRILKHAVWESQAGKRA